MKTKRRTAVVPWIAIAGMLMAGLPLLPFQAAGSLYTYAYDFQDQNDWDTEKGDWIHWWYGTNAVPDIRPWGAGDGGAPGHGLYLERGGTYDDGEGGTLTSGSAAHITYNGQGYLAETGETNTTGQFDDIEGSVVLSTFGGGAGTHAMVLLRATKHTMFTDSPANAYAVGASFSVGATTLGIWKDPASNTNAGTSLATTSIETDLRGTSLRLHFRAVDEDIDVWLYGWDEDDGDFTNLLGHVDTTDSSHSSGRFALRMGAGSAGRGVQFADMDLHVIPEPGTLALLLGGTVLLVLRRRRHA